MQKIFSKALIAAVVIGPVLAVPGAQAKPQTLPSDTAAQSRTPEAQAILDASTKELAREMSLLKITELRPPERSFQPRSTGLRKLR